MRTPEFPFDLNESSSVTDLRDVMSDCRAQILLPEDFRVDYRAKLQRIGENGTKVAILGRSTSATALHTEIPAARDTHRRKTWVNVCEFKRGDIWIAEAEAKEMIFPDRSPKIDHSYRISQLGELSTQAQLDVADSLRIIEAVL